MKNNLYNVFIYIISFLLGIIVLMSVMFYSFKNDVYKEIEILNKSIEETYSHVNSFYYFLDELPLGSPLDTLRITSKYGVRKTSNKRWRKHNGIDLGGNYKDSVHVTADGVVVKAGWFYGYGRCVVVEHYNNYTTLYAHLRKTLVKKGDTVCNKQIIGVVGNTGFSTGSHLHYEIRHLGKPKDPYYFIIFDQ